MKTLLASCLFVIACSSDPLAPGSGSSPGSGTGTLVVHGGASADAATPNAKDATQFTTDFQLQLSLNGQDVTTGTVTVTSHTGKTELTYDGNGDWRGSVANYDQVYKLDVVSGTDKITGVYVDGPDIHTFTAPTAGAAIDVTMTTKMTWNRGETAQDARFRVDGGGGDGLTIPDSGSYDIPALTLRYEKDQTKANTLRLTRTNSIVPKGAAAGSEFSVSVANELDVVAQACATCP